MSLSFHYQFKAPDCTSPQVLKSFLSSIEPQVNAMGFHETFILNGRFDSPEKHGLAKRLGCRYSVEHEALAGLSLPADGQIYNLDVEMGFGRLIPTYGVVLLAADKQGVEFCLGFLRFPKEIVDIHGQTPRRNRPQ